MITEEQRLMAITFESFSQQIEFLCESKHMEYIDAVILWCETNGVEVEYAANLIKKNQVLKLKIQIEAENLNYVKKTARLPL
jgi:hypothetical protein